MATTDSDFADPIILPGYALREDRRSPRVNPARRLMGGPNDRPLPRAEAASPTPNTMSSQSDSTRVLRADGTARIALAYDRRLPPAKSIRLAMVAAFALFAVAFLAAML
jgi:hypothetical protein